MNPDTIFSPSDREEVSLCPVSLFYDDLRALSAGLVQSFYLVADEQKISVSLIIQIDAPAGVPDLII